ncbi:MAG: hypothetical protein ACI3XY_08475 [Butyricicoccaceae bacterium]
MKAVGADEMQFGCPRNSVYAAAQSRSRQNQIRINRASTTRIPVVDVFTGVLSLDLFTDQPLDRFERIDAH